MKIHCASCGKLIDFRWAWHDLLSRTKVCNKTCLQKIRNEYAKMILRKESA